MRERRPGVYELRICLGVDPVTGRSRQISRTVHGDRRAAEARLADLTETQDAGLGVPATVAEVLERWLEADQPWRPSTLIGYRSVVRFLVGDPLGQMRAGWLLPGDVRTAVRRWQEAGASAAVTSGRFRALRSALAWAYTERLLDAEPLRHMRGPGRCPPRRPLPEGEVLRLLAFAELRVLEAVVNDVGPRAARTRRHRAEQDLLLVRLAADTGARRGELAALRTTDLNGQVLHICRAESGGELGPTKSGHGRVLTVGATTAQLWHDFVDRWCGREDTDTWLFSADVAHRRRLHAGALGHRFEELRDEADVPGATLHRLRHNVATFLVGRGEILQAQARLGHADAATTLREYAYALPLTDGDIARAIDEHLARPGSDVELGRDDHA